MSQRRSPVRTEAPSHWWTLLRGEDPHTHDEALDLLARHYQYLVEATALKFKTTLPSYIRDDDLISYAQLGLLKAIDRYDPEQGTFRKFASAYIYGAILDELRSQDWAPRGLRREQRQVREATAKLRRSRPEPSLSEVANHLGWDAARLQATVIRINNSHHQTLDGTEDIEVVSQASQETSVISDAACAEFVIAFDQLEPLTQVVVVRAFFNQETLPAIAQDTNLPLALIRKLHAEAIGHLFIRVRAVLL